MGLETCKIGAAVRALNTGDMKDRLKIPVNYSAIAPIVIGIPSGITRTIVRKDPIVLSWIK